MESIADDNFVSLLVDLLNELEKKHFVPQDCSVVFDKIKKTFG